MIVVSLHSHNHIVLTPYVVTLHTARTIVLAHSSLRSSLLGCPSVTRVLAIRCTHLLVHSYCFCSLCSLLIVYRYTHVRYAHYSLHYCLTFVALMLDTSANTQSRVCVMCGPKGPKCVHVWDLKVLV
jgi:hypothetical protein